MGNCDSQLVKRITQGLLNAKQDPDPNTGCRGSYSNCKALCKAKIEGPFIQKAEEKIPFKELQAFSFLPVSLSGVLVFFKFLLNVIKLKFLIITINFAGH